MGVWGYTLKGELADRLAEQDWTVNENRPKLIQHHSSHLLLHDDSISTRLVSYILYLPNSPSSLPSSSHSSLLPSASGAFTKGWDPAWGGALELYPVEGDGEVGVPGVKRLGKVDVKWGQIVFFEVSKAGYEWIDRTSPGKCCS